MVTTVERKGWRNKLRGSHQQVGFPGGSVGKEPACNAGDTGVTGLIPGSGRIPGEGHDNPIQYSCLENLMDKKEPGGL